MNWEEFIRYLIKKLSEFNPSPSYSYSINVVFTPGGVKVEDWDVDVDVVEDGDRLLVTLDVGVDDVDAYLLNNVLVITNGRKTFRVELPPRLPPYRLEKYHVKNGVFHAVVKT